jgi:hypothetical protein
MNKYALGTVLGSALLSILKSKGSKSYETLTVDDYIKQLTNGTGVVRYNFKIIYEPQIVNDAIKCDFHSEVIDATYKGIKESSEKINDLLREYDPDDWEWYSVYFGSEDFTIEDWEFYRDEKNQLYEDFLNYHAGIRNSWNNELTYSLFCDSSEYISSKNYFEWDTLEEYIEIFNASDLNIWFEDDMSFQDIAETIEAQQGFKPPRDRWGYYNEDALGIEHWAAKGGPLGIATGYIEFKIEGVDGIDLYFKLARGYYSIKSYITQVLSMAMDIAAEEYRDNFEDIDITLEQPKNLTIKETQMKIRDR